MVGVEIKADLAGQIDGMKKQAQIMVDSVFSFGELGFQEFETTKYLTGILEKAARIGNAQMRVVSFNDRRPDRIVWPDRKWEWAALRFEN